MTNLEHRTMRIYWNLHKKGPFGVFLQKIEASRDPEIIKIAKNYQDETFMNEVFFRKVAGRKEKLTITDRNIRLNAIKNCRLPSDKVYKKMERGADASDGNSDNGEDILNDPTICQRNILLNYYLFQRLKRRIKRRYSNIFRKRYDVPLTKDFCKQYLTVKKPEKFRKTSFLLWLNAYLKEKVSTEMLRLSSFEIALKAGNVWNTLPNEEKGRWYKLLNRDMYHHKF